MFVVGDRVRIKSCFSEDIKDRFTFNSKMKEYLGKESVIRSVASWGYKLEDVYDKTPEYDFLVNGDGYWIWAEEWLEDACSPISDVSDSDMEMMFQ